LFKWVKIKLGRLEWSESSSGARYRSVLSSILFNTMMDKIANKIRGKTKRLYMETLIYADDVLIFEKGENETEKSNQWINVEKEFNRMNMDKTVTMRISKNLDIVIRIKVNAQLLINM
jgi:hypothetical protein